MVKIQATLHAARPSFRHEVQSTARRWTLGNLSFVVMVLIAKFTFTQKKDELIYGTLDDRVYTMGKYENLQAWLMDPDRCPTTWPILLKIREQNPGYGAHPTPADASPAPSQL